MTTLVILLEEPSAREMLTGLLPRILSPDVDVHYLVFQGKQDLEKKLVRRIKGWRIPQTAFVVLRDQDSAQCEQVKEKLVDLCRTAGRPDILVRIACRELESWYFGDLSVVEAGLKVSGLSPLSAKAKYRNPDAIVNPASELRKITQGTYQKLSGSRAIGTLLSPEHNTSHSFRQFVEGVRRTVNNMAQ